MMILSKNGLAFQALKWYGYPDWRLHEGISLCKTFWSIMVGLLLVAPGRVIAYGWRQTLGRLPEFVSIPLSICLPLLVIATLVGFAGEVNMALALVFGGVLGGVFGGLMVWGLDRP